MKDKKLAIISITIIIVAVIILMLAIFGGGSEDTPAVLLPSAGSSSSSVSSAFASVTPDTVQAVISTLARPDNYSRTITTTDFWGSENKQETQLTVWVSGDSSKITVSRSPAQNILLTPDGIWIWYNGNANIFHSSSTNGPDSDKWSRILTYEELLSLKPSSITDAGYSKYAGEGCVWAEYTSPELGYRNREYISVNTGILMGIESFDGDTLIFKMTSSIPNITTQDPSIFTPPKN